MSKLSERHNVTGFCGQNDKYNLGYAKYVAEKKVLVATDGVKAIVVPVGDNECPDTLIPQKQLAAAAAGNEQLNVKNGDVRLDNKKVKQPSQEKYPDVLSLLPKEDPDVIFTLSSSSLRALADYADSNSGAESSGITLMINHAAGSTWKGRKVSSAVRFMIETAEEEGKAIPVAGVVMPWVPENSAAFNQRLAMYKRIATGTVETEPTPEPETPPSTEEKPKEKPKRKTKKPDKQEEDAPPPTTNGAADVHVQKAVKWLKEFRPLLARRELNKAKQKGFTGAKAQVLERKIDEAWAKKQADRKAKGEKVRKK